MQLGRGRQTITVDGHPALIALGKLGSIISEEVLCSNLKRFVSAKYEDFSVSVSIARDYSYK